MLDVKEVLPFLLHVKASPDQQERLGVRLQRKSRIPWCCRAGGGGGQGRGGGGRAP